jgi:cyclophilin family peptidyl-prolyl cis-trans isomerase/HEAT repeat protein
MRQTTPRPVRHGRRSACFALAVFGLALPLPAPTVRATPPQSQSLNSATKPAAGPAAHAAGQRSTTAAQASSGRGPGPQAAGSGPAARTQTGAKRPAPARNVVTAEVLLRIVRAEDERRWEISDLGQLLEDGRAAVRRRAALAAGRIGDEGAVNSLSGLLRRDGDEGVRAAAAFALGEIEAEGGSGALRETLRLRKTPAARARAVEALGKVAAALGEPQAARRRQLGAAVLSALAAEQKRPKPDRQTVLLGLTAALRARPEGGARAVAAFLDSKDARVRADAANALARLRAKESLERLREMLMSDGDSVVRANAARALGAAEDAAAFDFLLARASRDPDERVRVSALRSLAQLKDARAAAPLVRRGEELLNSYEAAKTAAPAAARPGVANELLEIATVLGRLLPNNGHEGALALLRRARGAGLAAPEVEVALARIAPIEYLRDPEVTDFVRRVTNVRGGEFSWQRASAVGQGLGELAVLTSEQVGNSAASLQADAQIMLRSLLADTDTPALAAPDLLRALAAFKPPDLAEAARAQLAAADVIVRATAADILGELPPDAESARALAAALPRALQEDSNDAALSILGALARQPAPEATEAVRAALEVPDYLVRRRAAEILRGGARAGEGGRRVETANTRNREADYGRALARVGREVTAKIETEKGAFTIELLPEAAPLTVDNFVELARRRYFNGVAFHRVVPNFVVQGGDPRGDGNGGPGYQIRCEINTVAYDRGAVGMALSGKDTGGSQWFVTHSPQPHLDGGYTVFGRVTSGMEVVDRLVRGDRIRFVTVAERDKKAPAATPKKR